VRGIEGASRTRLRSAALVAVDEALAELVAFYKGRSVLHLDPVAAERLPGLRDQKIRIGTMDLKIAAIVLGPGATLLSVTSVTSIRCPA
jgi:hypothetical protein